MARGAKYGGRVKGTPNKATAAKAEAIASSGLTPLDFMLDVMRDQRNPLHLRASAAKDAAPYVHPRLANIEHTGRNGGPIEMTIGTTDAGL